MLPCTSFSFVLVCPLAVTNTLGVDLRGRNCQQRKVEIPELRDKLIILTMNLLIQEKNKTFNNYALLLDSFGSDTKIGHGFSNENVFLVIYLIKTILTILLDTTTVTYSISVNLLFHQESQIVMPRAIRPIKLRVLGSAQESWKEWCFLRMYAYQQCSSSKPNPLCRLSLSYKMPF